MGEVRVERLAAERHPEIARVLTDAFLHYPVMRLVSGPEPEAESRIAQFIGYFVYRRGALGGPLLGLFVDGELVGAATMTLPEERAASPSLDAEREAMWTAIGPGARDRYELYAAVAKTFQAPKPHHHLNMLGIATAYQGRGFARPLLQAAIDLTRADPASQGLTLTTELEHNVRLYEHFGFQRTGRKRVGDAFDSWGMFRQVHR
jgi:ribosomal protein S18 acetylase RimI-like enzyme